MDILSKLISLKEDAIKDDKKIKELSDFMQSKEVQDIIHELLEKESLTKDDVPIGNEIIRCAQVIFENSGYETGISDYDYDDIYEKVAMFTEMEISAPISKNKEKVYHRYQSLRGTLDKVYALTDDEKLQNKSRKSLDDWIKSCENKIYEKTGIRMDISREEVYLFPKWDGVSGIEECTKNGELERLLLRGFTTTNETKDVSHLFKGKLSGPYTGRDRGYGLKTEIVMSNKDCAEYNKKYGTDYKQSRSIVSSIINSDEADDRVNYLQFMQLRISELGDNGEEGTQSLAPGAFDTPYHKCRLCDREEMKSFAESHSIVNDIRCDGMVIYIINPEIQQILGRENNKQKFEVAYKFTEEVGYSKIKSIHFKTGLFGRITPVAEIKPIVLKGNTVTEISLGSMPRFNELKLAVGDKVKILYDVIPYLVYDKENPNCKRSDNQPIPAPLTCPDCGADLVMKENEGLMYCENPKCPCKRKGKILNYLNKMNIDNISYATVDDFYDAGYLKKIQDLYKLEDNKKKLMNLPGYGKTSVENIIASINKHLDVTPYQLLGSIGIEGIGLRKFKAILKVITFDELMEYTINESEEARAITLLSSIPGVQEKTAKKIVDGIRENEKLIEFLEEVLTVHDDTTNEKPEYSVLFTKVRSKEMEDFIKENKGEVVESISKNVDLVVVPMLGVTSSKVTKANDYGIPVVELDKVKDYITTNFLNKRH